MRFLHTNTRTAGQSCFRINGQQIASNAGVAAAEDSKVCLLCHKPDRNPTHIPLPRLIWKGEKGHCMFYVHAACVGLLAHCSTTELLGTANVVLKNTAVSLTVHRHENRRGELTFETGEGTLHALPIRGPNDRSQSLDTVVHTSPPTSRRRSEGVVGGGEAIGVSPSKDLQLSFHQ